MTSTASRIPARPAASETNRVLSEYVARKITRLQQMYLSDASSAAGSLARLRRAVNRGAGEDPAVWTETFEGFPADLLGRGDRPSRHEWAVHAAITLYAVHQQSKDRPMHRPGSGIGAAARTLGSESGSEEAVLRRFQMLGTSTSFEETLHHMRGLITQFRAHGIGLDYGRLAADLADIQNERRADRVRLAWGRDYYRVTDPTRDAATSAETPTASDN